MTHLSLSALLDPALPKSPPGSFMMPIEGSTNTHLVDDPYMFLVWMSLAITAGVVAVMVVFVKKYRATDRAANEQALSKVDHDTTLEITWSAIPFVVVIGLFAWGFKGFVELRTSPKDSYEIKAQGQKWKWLFTYPNGYTDDQLHIPPHRNVRMVISSVDVLHSLFIPAFRTKMDAVPGRYTSLWFNAKEVGNFPIFCAEYCGTSHSDMITQVVVHPTQADFDTWLESADGPPGGDVAAWGEKLFSQRGCTTCHSVDGTPKVGPSMKGVFGRQEALADGTTVTVDENYLRESMLEPQAKIVKGFTPSMPTFKGQLKDRHLDALITYVKTLK